MSHEIRQFDVQQGREMAWHGLTDVNPELSLGNCWLRKWDYVAKPLVLDGGEKTPFHVLGVSDDCKMPLILPDGKESQELIPLAIGRPYDPASFKPIFNALLIEKLEKALAGQGLTLESCGTVMNRARLFLSFGMAGAQFKAAGRDFKAFLNIGNGQDMSSPFWMNTSNTCTVCNNTFQINMDSRGYIMEVKKTRFSELKIQNLDKAIAAMLKGQEEFAKMFGKLGGIECDEKTAREFFAGFIGDIDSPLSTRAENTVERLTVLYKQGNGNDGNDYSDVFSALTDYYTHESASREDDKEAKWKNFVSSEFGSARNKKMESWELLTDEKKRKGVVSMGRKVLQLTAKAHRDAEAA